MSATPPTETLNLPMNGEDSSNLRESSEISSQPTAPIETTTTEKRKREDEPDPSSDPDRKQHPLWKTSLCSYFRRSDGLCSHGETCRYAHGELELRPRPDNTWDPTSERAKKLARKDDGNGENVDEVEKGGGEVMMTEAFEDDDGGSATAAAEAGLAKCLVNLPMRWTSDNLRNFLNEQGIIFKSAKKKKGMVVGILSFDSAAQVKKAIEELDGKSFGNESLKVADVIPQTFVKKDKVALAQSIQQDETRPSFNESSSIDESENNLEDGEPINNISMGKRSDSRARSARDVVAPLSHMPYADQLENKKNTLMQTLKRLTRNARKACPNGVSLPEWILKSREIGGLPCKFDGIIESPLINGYRNKCEFSVGYSLQGKATVGFLLGTFREGVTAVQEPEDCPNVSRISCRYAAIFQNFLENSSLPIWNRLNNTGFWRQLTVRTGRALDRSAEAENSEASITEVMLMVQVCTAGLDDALVNGELENLAHAFSLGSTEASPHLPLTVLVVQDHTGISNAAPSDAPLHSLIIPKENNNLETGAARDVVEARIHDYINNLRFSISPTAFFQVNTLAAEKLYTLAGDWAGLGPDTLLFDICCGTGTIGLNLAHRVGTVVGIEMNASAVSDAQRNAEINGIKNCRFVCAKAEDVMGSLLKEYVTLSRKEEKEDEVPEELTEGNKDIEIADGKLNVDVKCEECSAPEQPNGQLEFGSLENGSLDGNQLQKCSIAKNSAATMPQFKNIVAIVDPPHVGLHPTVIKVLRTHPTLRRVVYISCNPESLVANAI